MLLHYREQQFNFIFFLFQSMSEFVWDHHVTEEALCPVTVEEEAALSFLPVVLLRCLLFVLEGTGGRWRLSSKAMVDRNLRFSSQLV